MHLGSHQGRAVQSPAQTPALSFPGTQRRLARTGRAQRRWQGFRLCAVDASVVNLPDTPEIRAHYQPDKPAAQACMQARAQCRALGVSEAPLRVRLVRVELPGPQQPELLITSLLDTVTYPHELFAALYHQRWGVEEDYKRLKSRQRLEQFSGQSVLCIEQDFHAKVLNKNLTAVFSADAQARVDVTCAGRKHAYRVNFTAALANLEQALPTLLLGHSPPALGRPILAALAKTVEPLRPDRSVPRWRRRGPKYPPAYKPIP